MNPSIVTLAAVALTLASMPTARAQMAVVDAQSLGQLQQQIRYWEQQIDGMSNQIKTLRDQLASTTGARGMGGLLKLTNAQRNYLPANTTQLASLTDAAQSLPSEIRTAYDRYIASQNALQPAQASTLSVAEKNAINGRRSAIATRASAMQVATSAASQRFSQIQSLIDEIDKTVDPKGIQDLQGRIAAEQVMALNEVAKITAIAGWADSNIDVVRTRTSESVIASHGLFSHRFEPSIH